MTIDTTSNTETTLLQPLQQALAQSRALLSMAQADDWESFEVLVQRRQQCLLDIQKEAYLASLANAGLESQAAEVVAAIKTLNEQLASLAESQKIKVSSELRHISKSEKAINSYTS